VILACTVLIQITSVTDGQTDRRLDDGQDARNILLSPIKMHAIDRLDRLFYAYRTRNIAPITFLTKVLDVYIIVTLYGVCDV